MLGQTQADLLHILSVAFIRNVVEPHAPLSLATADVFSTPCPMSSHDGPQALLQVFWAHGGKPCLGRMGHYRHATSRDRTNRVVFARKNFWPDLYPQTSVVDIKTKFTGFISWKERRHQAKSTVFEGKGALFSGHEAFSLWAFPNQHVKSAFLFVQSDLLAKERHFEED